VFDLHHSKKMEENHVRLIYLDLKSPIATHNVINEQRNKFFIFS